MEREGDRGEREKDKWQERKMNREKEKDRKIERAGEVKRAGRRDKGGVRERKSESFEHLFIDETGIKNHRRRG